MSKSRSGSLPFWLPDLLLAIALVAAPFVLPPLGFAPDTISRIIIIGLFGIGFDLLFGYTGLLSFGHSAFFGTGGFVASYLLVKMGVSSLVVALVIGTFVATVTGYLVGLIALRRTGIYFTMITVAITEVFFFLGNSPLSEFTGGDNGLAGVPTPTFDLNFINVNLGKTWSTYAFVATCYLLGMLIARRIVRSPIGHILVAIRDNPLRAAAVGHDVKNYKLLAFMIAAAYAGVAGGLLGSMQGFMPPDAFAFETSGQLVMQSFIGGLGTLYGPLVGAAVWLYLRDFLQGPLGLGAAWKLALGVIFVLLVCFLRRGILGGLRDLWDLSFAGTAAASVNTARTNEPAPSGSPELNGVVEKMAVRRRCSESVAGPILKVEGLTKRFGGLTANSDIDFSVNRGEVRGVIGPNGAGKSTFFKMLTCELAPTSGRISFEGGDITGKSVTDICQLGLTKSYQVNQLFSRLTVRENVTIAALATLRGKFRFDPFRNLERIPGLSDQVPHTLCLIDLESLADKPVSELSYGEKRRLEIGLALASSPSLLLLDEPLAGMSPQERIDIVKMLRSVAEGRTMIVIDHDVDSLFELTQRITVLQEGRILAEGTPEEIKANVLVQNAYLGGITES